MRNLAPLPAALQKPAAPTPAMRTRSKTKEEICTTVVSNADIVECILSSFGSAAPKAGRVSRLWLEAAQRVLARCRVVGQHGGALVHG